MSSSISNKSITQEKLDAAVEIQDVKEGSTLSVQPEAALAKTFNIWSVIGMVYSSFATPISLGTYLSLVIGVGGAPFFLYDFLMVGTMCLVTAYSIAEIASVYPHTSAQIYWTQMMAPPKYARVLSYVSGIISCTCYIFGSCATAYFAASLLISFIEMWNPGYTSQTWHMYLVYLATILFGTICNIFGARYLHLLSSSMNYLINGGTLFIFIALLARAYPKQSASYVFKDVVNATGWSSDGVVFFIGMLPGASAVALFDGACHMTDEIPEPEKNIPLVIFYSYTGAVLIGIVAIIIYMFCTVNVANLSDPIGGQPIFQLFYDAYDNKGLTIVSGLIVILIFVGAVVTVFASTSRLVMSFSRLGSLPYGNFFGSISVRFRTSFGGLVFNAVAISLIGLLMFASSAALNAVMGSYVSMMYLSYIIPFVCLILKKDRFGPNSNHYFNLGKFGKPMNIICVIWFLFVIVWLNMPSYLPVTPNNMNYTSAVMGCAAAVGITNWFFYARKHFKSILDVDVSHS